MQPVDLAVLTILPEEFDAVRRLLNSPILESGSASHPNMYQWTCGTVQPSRFTLPYRVAVAMIGRAGRVDAGAAVTDLVIRWEVPPRYIALCGIAGGLRGSQLNKGDVIIAEIIHGYEYGKVLSDGFHPRPERTFQLDTALKNAAMSPRGLEWVSGIGVLPPRPHLPKVVDGPVGSGDKVIDDTSDPFFQAVTSQFSRLKAVEMEAEGVAAMVQSMRDRGSAVGLMMVRGISDLPLDTHPPLPIGVTQTEERDAWKKYASRAAACFLIEVLKNTWPVPPRQGETLYP